MIISGVIDRSVDKVRGRNDFHVRYISLSYRIRGIDARSQMKVEAAIMVIKVDSRFLE